MCCSPLILIHSTISDVADLLSLKYETLCSGLGELLEVEGAGLMTSLDDMLISKATAILQENDELHSQLSSLKSSLEACDMDARAGRYETVNMCFAFNLIVPH